jgi:hypothetical protein
VHQCAGRVLRPGADQQVIADCRLIPGEVGTLDTRGGSVPIPRQPVRRLAVRRPRRQCRRRVTY